MVDALQNARGECFFPQDFPFLALGPVWCGSRTAPSLAPAVVPHKVVLTGGALLALSSEETFFFMEGEATNRGFGTPASAPARGAEPTKHPLKKC